MKKKLTIITLILSLCLVLVSCGGKAPRTSSPKTEDMNLTISIYAFNGKSERLFGIVNMGHAFVSIKNHSAAELSVGNYTLSGGEEVTIGTWGQTAHWGIWYNLEAHYMSIGRYSGIVSITRGLENGKLEQIGEYLNNSDYWTPFTNCSAFALSLWNLVSDDDQIDIVGLVTPMRLCQEILRFTNYQTDNTITPINNASFWNGSSLTEAELLAG